MGLVKYAKLINLLIKIKYVISLLDWETQYYEYRKKLKKGKIFTKEIA